MTVLRKLLRLLFPNLFDYVEVDVVRFVPRINTKSLANMLKSDEFKFFTDNCERKARILGEDTYKGVVFVSGEAEMMLKKVGEKKEQTPQVSNVLRLDDAGLLEERYGKATD